VKERGIKMMETIGDSPVNLKWTWTRTGHGGTRHPGRCVMDLDNVSTTEEPDDGRKRWIRVGCEEREREDDWDMK
jgi:hypothetical protein